MKLILKAPYGNDETDAFRFARDRGILPTWMGTSELRELEAGLRDSAVFSARTTNAVYLEALRERIQRFIADGYNGDRAKLRLELKELLRELAYDPETGFPGDEELGIEPAMPGSLRDLSSDRRINLILDTQLSLMAGKGQQQRGLSAAALELFPAYELVRIRTVRSPRDWETRWVQAGGVIRRDATGRVRLAALKTDEIWSVLGDPAVFPDALGVSYPPFCFSSGMGWQEMDAEEWAELSGQPILEAAATAAPVVIPEAVKKVPPVAISSAGLSREAVLRLRETLRKAEAKGGRLTLASTRVEPPPPPPRKQVRTNAATWDLDGLLDLADLADLAEEINAKARRNRGTQVPGKKCGKSWIAAWKKCDKQVDAGATSEQIKRDENHHLQPEEWHEFHPRSEARRGGKAAEAHCRAVLGQRFGADVPQEVSRITGAEVTAVLMGRKPMHHEAWGDDIAPDLARAWQPLMPAGVTVEAFGPHLVLYRPTVVKKIMDADASFYGHEKTGLRSALHAVVEKDEMGELLGYGLRRPGRGHSRVSILSQDEAVAGFVVDAKSGEPFLRDRLKDYSLYLRQPLTAVIE